MPELTTSVRQGSSRAPDAGDKQRNTNLQKQVLERLRRDKLVYALIIFHNSLFYKQRQGRIRHRSDDRLHTFGNNFTSKNKTPWTVSAASRWTARQLAAFLSTYRSRCLGRCPYNLSLDLSFGRRDETSPLRSAPRGSLICRWLLLATRSWRRRGSASRRVGPTNRRPPDAANQGREGCSFVNWD